MRQQTKDNLVRSSIMAAYIMLVVLIVVVVGKADAHGPSSAPRAAESMTHSWHHPRPSLPHPAVVHHSSEPTPAPPTWMYDSASPSGIPNGLGRDAVIAFYNDGSWPWPKSTVARFAKHHRMLSIDVNGSKPSDNILDVEQGDATPWSAIPWVKARLRLHTQYPPIVYSDRQNYWTVVFNLKHAGLTPGKDFKMWAATANPRITSFGSRHVTIGAQNVWTPNYDRSVIHDRAFARVFSP